MGATLSFMKQQSKWDYNKYGALLQETLFLAMVKQKMASFIFQLENKQGR